jgi:hypothetical protein
MNDLSQKAEKSLNLIFQLYKKFRDEVESLSTSDLDQLRHNPSDSRFQNLLQL